MWLGLHDIPWRVILRAGERGVVPAGGEVAVGIAGNLILYLWAVEMSGRITRGPGQYGSP
jgi:hypothetical protein